MDGPENWQARPEVGHHLETLDSGLLSNERYLIEVDGQVYHIKPGLQREKQFATATQSYLMHDQIRSWHHHPVDRTAYHHGVELKDLVAGIPPAVTESSIGFGGDRVLLEDHSIAYCPQCTLFFEGLRPKNDIPVITRLFEHLVELSPLEIDPRNYKIEHVSGFRRGHYVARGSESDSYRVSYVSKGYTWLRVYDFISDAKSIRQASLDYPVLAELGKDLNIEPVVSTGKVLAVNAKFSVAKAYSPLIFFKMEPEIDASSLEDLWEHKAVSETQLNGFLARMARFVARFHARSEVKVFDGYHPEPKYPAYIRQPVVAVSRLHHAPEFSSWLVQEDKLFLVGWERYCDHGVYRCCDRNLYRGHGAECGYMGGGDLFFLLKDIPDSLKPSFEDEYVKEWVINAQLSEEKKKLAENVIRWTFRYLNNDPSLPMSGPWRINFPKLLKEAGIECVNGRWSEEVPVR